MADDHKELPPPKERSMLNRGGHYVFTEDYTNSKTPWPCNSHHILPAAAFKESHFACKPDKKDYVLRCILVSRYNVNSGPRFKGELKPKGENNLVRLPKPRAYRTLYQQLEALTASQAKALATASGFPVNECMHQWGGWSEHQLYNKEVYSWLDREVWSKLQENKKEHKNKGKDIRDMLFKGEGHFRAELVARGKRTTAAGNSGTVECWLAKPADDDQRSLPFSMAATPARDTKAFCTEYPK